MEELFIVETMPERVKYRPGDEISYEGISFSLDGAAVPLDEVSFSVPEGSMWQRRDWSLDVVASYADCETVFTLKRERKFLVPLLLLLAAVVAASVVLIATGPLSPDDDVIEGAGTSIYTGLSGMSDEEKQRFVDEKTAASEITVSLASKPELWGDRLRVNFIVEKPNNGFSERLEIEQDGRVICRSDVVAPGGKVEFLDAPGVHVGSATATIYAVSDAGDDVGAPLAFEIEIANKADAAELPASSASGPVSEAVAGPVAKPMPAAESVPVSEPEPAPVAEPEPEPEPVPAVCDLGASFVGWELPASGVVDYQGLGWYMCHSNTWQGALIASLRPGDVVMVDGVAYTVAGVTRAGVGESVADWRFAYKDYKLFSTCIEDGSNDVWIVYAS